MSPTSPRSRTPSRRCATRRGSRGRTASISSSASARRQHPDRQLGRQVGDQEAHRDHPRQSRLPRRHGSGQYDRASDQQHGHQRLAGRPAGHPPHLRFPEELAADLRHQPGHPPVHHHHLHRPLRGRLHPQSADARRPGLGRRHARRQRHRRHRERLPASRGRRGSRPGQYRRGHRGRHGHHGLDPDHDRRLLPHDLRLGHHRQDDPGPRPVHRLLPPGLALRRPDHRSPVHVPPLPLEEEPPVHRQGRPRSASSPRPRLSTGSGSTRPSTTAAGSSAGPSWPSSFPWPSSPSWARSSSPPRTWT